MVYNSAVPRVATMAAHWDAHSDETMVGLSVEMKAAPMAEYWVAKMVDNSAEMRAAMLAAQRVAHSVDMTVGLSVASTVVPMAEHSGEWKAVLRAAQMDKNLAGTRVA